MTSLGAYGPVVFTTSAQLIRNFEDLKVERRARYATHDVLNLDQLLQFLGHDLGRIEFSMHFHQAFCVPQEELDALARINADHTAYPLVIGGRVLGDYVLEELRDQWSHVSARGQILAARAEVRLKEYH